MASGVEGAEPPLEADDSEVKCTGASKVKWTRERDIALLKLILVTQPNPFLTNQGGKTGKGKEKSKYKYDYNTNTKGDYKVKGVSKDKGKGKGKAERAEAKGKTNTDVECWICKKKGHR